MRLLATLAASAAALSAHAIIDDFETYLAGTFPSANWEDASLIAPVNGPPPNPSCVVDKTTDAFGNGTLALHLDSTWVGASSGVWRKESIAAVTELTFDFRIDSFGSGATGDVTDWAFDAMIGKARDDIHVGAWNSMQIYASNMSQDFRGYTIDSGQFEDDLPYGLKLETKKWYHVRATFDKTIGSIRSEVWDIAANALLLDATVQDAGWTLADGDFNAVSFNQGELSALESADAWIDNINVVPEPATLAVLGCALAALVRRRR
ncbi:MAG: hypothetical protein HONBIEJF_00562 [Fimbriimonadaceae bacterium]|nr:hypothetical protein [Fimbriimonadaceae bacterium]